MLKNKGKEIIDIAIKIGLTFYYYHYQLTMTSNLNMVPVYFGLKVENRQIASIFLLP